MFYPRLQPPELRTNEPSEETSRVSFGGEVATMPNNMDYTPSEAEVVLGRNVAVDVSPERLFTAVCYNITSKNLQQFVQSRNYEAYKNEKVSFLSIFLFSLLN